MVTSRSGAASRRKVAWGDGRWCCCDAQFDYWNWWMTVVRNGASAEGGTHRFPYSCERPSLADSTLSVGPVELGAAAGFFARQTGGFRGECVMWKRLTFGQPEIHGSLDLPHPFRPELHGKRQRQSRQHAEIDGPISEVRATVGSRLSSPVCRRSTCSSIDSLHTGRNMRFELRTVWPAMHCGDLALADDVGNQCCRDFVREVGGPLSMVLRSADGPFMFGAIRKDRPADHGGGLSPAARPSRIVSPSVSGIRPAGIATDHSGLAFA
jgi:hypothetical protein